jgi:hypothetical protein
MKGNRALPWFEVKDNKICNTSFHPDGRSGHPELKIRGSSVYSKVHHAEGVSHHPIFEMRH